MEKNEQKVAESQENIIAQAEECLSNVQTEKCIEIEQQKQSANTNKKSLTPYQKYKNSRNQNGKKYFEFYDDIKVYTHNIYDW